MVSSCVLGRVKNRPPQSQLGGALLDPLHSWGNGYPGALYSSRRAPCDIPTTVRLSRHSPCGLAGDHFELTVGPLHYVVEVER
jgi:hypothetical protein